MLIFSLVYTRIIKLRMFSEIVQKIKQVYSNSKYPGVNKVLKMRKILGILLGVCFLLSVTAAAVSEAPFDGKIGYNNHNDCKKKIDNHNDCKKKIDNHNDGKKKYFMEGHWGYKRVKHNKDKHHQTFWYRNEGYWIPGYYYWK